MLHTDQVDYPTTTLRRQVPKTDSAIDQHPVHREVTRYYAWQLDLSYVRQTTYQKRMADLPADLYRICSKDATIVSKLILFFKIIENEYQGG